MPAAAVATTARPACAQPRANKGKRDRAIRALRGRVDGALLRQHPQLHPHDLVARCNGFPILSPSFDSISRASGHGRQSLQARLKLHYSAPLAPSTMHRVNNTAQHVIGAGSTTDIRTGEPPARPASRCAPLRHKDGSCLAPSGGAFGSVPLRAQPSSLSVVSARRSHQRQQLSSAPAPPSGPSGRAFGSAPFGSG